MMGIVDEVIRPMMPRQCFLDGQERWADQSVIHIKSGRGRKTMRVRNENKGDGQWTTC